MSRAYAITKVYETGAELVVRIGPLESRQQIMQSKSRLKKSLEKLQPFWIRLKDNRFVVSMASSGVRSKFQFSAMPKLYLEHYNLID